MRQTLLTLSLLALTAFTAFAQGTTENILEYDGTDAFVLETTSGQWYARNNHSLYERYGVVEAVASLTAATTYDGKYARVGTKVYRYANERWNATNITVSRATVPADGVYVVSRDGTLVPTSAWSGQQAAGIAVVSDGGGYVVATHARTLEQTMTLAANSSELTLYGSAANALADASGRENTATMVSLWGSHATAATYCRDYGFAWGAQGYLPSAQEAQGVLADAAVAEALALVGGWSATEVSALATSSMQTPTKMWCATGTGTLEARDVADEATVVPLAPLPAVTLSYPYPDSPDISAAPSDGLIHFADPVARQVCVELYDTDGDGELSYAEAAAVRDIDYDFAGQAMTTLDELVYFTQIEDIYSGSFIGCPNLESVTLPASMSVIWSGPFHNCPKLRYIHVDDGNKALCSDDGVLLNRIRTTLFKCPQAYPGTYVMPSTVMQVQYRAFQGCTALTGVDISLECTYIDLDAFANCSALQTVKVHWQNPLVPSSDIFSGVDLSQLTLYVPSGTKSAYQQASPWSGFGTIVEYDDATATAIAFADDEVKRVCVAHWDTNGDGELSYTEAAQVTSLGGAFSGNELITSLRELQYFTRVQTLAAGEFEGCRLLESIILPPPLRTIGSRAFKDCESLATLSLSSGVRSIATGAFDGMTAFKGFTVATSNSYFCQEDGALYDKAKTRLIKYPPSLSYAKLSLPTTLTTIDDRAVQGATNITRVVMPVTLKTIGARAFQGCTKLRTLTLPGLVNTIGEYAFADCTALPSVTVPSDVTTVPVGAFAGCSALAEVTVATPQTAIASNAFAGTPVTTLPITEGTTTEIGDYAFARCPAITGLELPSGLLTIGSGAFADCAQLSLVKVPATVTAIGSKAFHIDALKELTVFIPTPLTITDNTFARYDDCTLYVPAASLKAYKEAPVWKRFLTILPILAGDVNHDGYVNIFDVTLVIDYILDKNPEGFYVEEADVNGDGFINVFDVTLIIDIILQK